MNKKMLIGVVMTLVGFFVYDTYMVPASPLQLLAWAGLICNIVGGVIVIKELIKLRKNQKKEDEENKKW